MNRVIIPAIDISFDAWCWLGWIVPDAKTGETHRLPIETYSEYPFFD